MLALDIDIIISSSFAFSMIVSSSLLFLASDEAGYITGTQLVVDGGVTAAR